MNDERTKKLFELFFKQDSYNINNIFSTELNEFDCLRLYRLLSITDPNNAKGNTEHGKKDSVIAKYQLDKLNSDAKLFRVTKEVNNLLNLTNPSSIKNLKLPFDCLFIDTDFFINNDIRVFGIFIQLRTIELAKEINKKALETIGKKFYPELEYFDGAIVSCLFFSKEKGFFSFIDLNINLENGKYIKTIEEIQNKKITDRLIKKKVKDYVLNLLLFLNEPRITIYITPETNNKRRIKKGLIPIPSQLRTEIDINLKQYIDKIYFNGLSHSKLGYSFWVRGHWRKLISVQWKNKQGQKIWILPHLKGEGLTPPQVFILKSDKNKFKDKDISE